MLSLLFAVAPSSAGADEVYRWVDPSGGVHFSDRPPADGESRVLEVESCDTPACRAEQAQAKERLQELLTGTEAWWERYRERLRERGSAAQPQEEHNETPFHKFRTLQTGMSKAEVLLRVGKPDISETLEGRFGGKVGEKWYYLPHLKGGWLSGLFFDAKGYLARLNRIRP
jgi:hypothetical protein